LLKETKRHDIANWSKRHKISLCEDLSLEEAMDQS